MRTESNVNMCTCFIIYIAAQKKVSGVEILSHHVFVECSYKILDKISGFKIRAIIVKHNKIDTKLLMKITNGIKSKLM